jgi:hypothetical protein
MLLYKTPPISVPRNSSLRNIIWSFVIAITVSGPGARCRTLDIKKEVLQRPRLFPLEHSGLRDKYVPTKLPSVWHQEVPGSTAN